MTPRHLAWLVAAAAGGTLACFMTLLPIQLIDGGSNMISVADATPWQLFLDKATNEAFFRPLMWPPYLLVMQWSGGHYFAWFKTIHVLQLAGLVGLFLRWMRVETRVDLVAFGFGLAVLVGGHTFPGTVREAFPINHFLAVAVCTLGVAVLSAERPHWRNGLAGVLLLAYAALTIESGLLVWVAAVWAWWIGWQGIPKRWLAVMTLLVVAYLGVRFGWLHTGTPDLLERGSGYGFGYLDAAELQRRFADRPHVFYGYNLVAAILTQLIAEPRGGVYRFVGGLVEGPVEAWVVVNVIAATGVVALIGWAMWARLRAWGAGLTHHDRILWMWPVMLLANAVFCYAYVKDVVLSAAGVFAAGAAAAAMREGLLRLEAAPLRRGAVAASVLLMMLASVWSIKFIGIHHSVRKESFAVRKEWAQVDAWIEREQTALDTPAKRAVKERLEQAALARPAAPPWPRLLWPNSWYDETQ